MAFMGLVNVVSILNALMLFILLYVYIRNYKAIKSKFSLGLILFGLLFLIQNLVAIYFQTAMVDYYSKEVADFALILNILEALGFAALLYVTWKP